MVLYFLTWLYSINWWSRSFSYLYHLTLCLPDFVAEQQLQIMNFKSVLTLGCGRSSNGWKLSRSVYTCDLGNVEIPDQPFNEYLWQNADKFPNKAALTCGNTGRSYSYKYGFTGQFVHLAHYYVAEMLPSSALVSPAGLLVLEQLKEMLSPLFWITAQSIQYFSQV